MLELEIETQSDDSGNAKKMAQWLRMLRHLVTHHVIECAARPRNREGLIASESSVLRDLMGNGMAVHMETVYDTAEWMALQEIVRPALHSNQKIRSAAS